MAGGLLDASVILEWDDPPWSPIARYPHGPLADRIWARRENLPSYDAAFVSLSEALGAPLVTCDGRLATAPGHSAEVEVFVGQGRDGRELQRASGHVGDLCHDDVSPKSQRSVWEALKAPLGGEGGVAGEDRLALVVARADVLEQRPEQRVAAEGGDEARENWRCHDVDHDGIGHDRPCDGLDRIRLSQRRLGDFDVVTEDPS